MGGQGVWRDYLTWGQERLAELQRALARRGRRNVARIGSLYRPATTPVDHLPWAYLPIRNGPQGSFPRSGDALVFWTASVSRKEGPP